MLIRNIGESGLPSPLRTFWHTRNVCPRDIRRPSSCSFGLCSPTQRSTLNRSHLRTEAKHYRYTLRNQFVITQHSTMTNIPRTTTSKNRSSEEYIIFLCPQLEVMLGDYEIITTCGSAIVTCYLVASLLLLWFAGTARSRHAAIYKSGYVKYFPVAGLLLREQSVMVS